MINNIRLVLFTIVILTLSCQNNTKKNTSTISVQNEKVDQQWVSLSLPNSLDGWHIYQDKTGQKTGWSVNDGVFTYNSRQQLGKAIKA